MTAVISGKRRCTFRLSALRCLTPAEPTSCTRCHHKHARSGHARIADRERVRRPGSSSSANWYGIAVPVGTPRAIVTRLHTAATAALNDPALRQRINDSGYVIIGSTSEEFALYVKSQVDSLAKVVRALI